MKVILCKLLGVTLFLHGITCDRLIAQNKIEGYILDKSSNRAVTFAHLSIKGKPTIGTVSNEDGFFRLGIPDLMSSDSLIISHIIYATRILPLLKLQEQNPLQIFLSEDILELSEVQVKATEDYQAFRQVVIETKKTLHFPMTATLYYREFVKENKAYNKFADGILTVVYEQNKNDNDIKIKVNQSRSVKLPKDEDDQFELVSPLKIQWVLEYEFGNFLNRFGNENQANYHFYSIIGDSKQGNLLIVEPKREANREKGKLLYQATIRTDKNNHIKDVKLEMDSLCRFEKSLLGLKYKIMKSSVTLSFKNNGTTNYLAFARFNFGLKFSTKKFQQVEDFVSEFITLNVNPGGEVIEGRDLFKKSSLFKHGNKYDYPFWNGINLPVPTKEEEKLVNDLANKSN